MKEIDIKYKKNITGVYNKAVDVCPYCGNRMTGRLFDNCKGIASVNYGDMMLIECDKCFETFYFHGDEFYFYFLQAIKEGTNKFFQEQKTAEC